jgi:hypothetical protein
MRGAILPLPQHVFMAWCLAKHRDNFSFTFTFYYARMFLQELRKTVETLSDVSLSSYEAGVPISWVYSSLNFIVNRWQ